MEYAEGSEDVDSDSGIEDDLAGDFVYNVWQCFKNAIQTGHISPVLHSRYFLCTLQKKYTISTTKAIKVVTNLCMSLSCLQTFFCLFH